MASSIVTAPAEKALIRNPIYVTLETSLMSGGSPPYTPDEDNLSCRLEVWRDVDAGEEMLARLKAPYSTDDKQVTFDISRLLPRVIALPTPESIGISPGDPYSGEAEGLTDVYRLKHADQYGDPVTPEALTTSDDYLAIHGGVPADALQSISFAGALIGLHSYYWKRHDAFTFLKPVSTSQPDWIYFVALVTDDVEVTVTIHYTDGTFESYVSHTIAVEANRAYWTQAGHDQLKIADNADPDKTVNGYDVSLVRVTGMQNAFTAFFVLDDMCPSWEKFLLYHNGLGGYESVRMKGITEYGHEVSRETFERTRWTDFDVETGEFDDTRVLGGPVFNTHTGHYPAYYVEHLRQLLHGKLWIIDTDLGEILNDWRFKKIRVDTTQLRIRTDVPAADGFAITYRHGWLDDGFNIF